MNTFRIATSKAVTVVLIGLLSAMGLLAQTGPVIAAVVDGASFQPMDSGGLVYNTYITIFGTNLASNTRTWTSSDFVSCAQNGQPPLCMPTSLDGVSVSTCSDLGIFTTSSPCAIASLSAYVEYISPTQINILTGFIPQLYSLYSGATVPPTGVIVEPPVTVVVQTPYGTSNAFPVPITICCGLPLVEYCGLYQPNLFTVGNNYVAARHLDGTLVGKADMLPGVVSRPAQPGETIELYGTGFGPAGPIGELVTEPIKLGCPTGPPYQGNFCSGDLVAVFPSLLLLSEAAVIPDWAGLVEAGLYQINITIPTSFPDGDLLFTVQMNFWTTYQSSVISTATVPDVLLTIQNPN